MFGIFQDRVLSFLGLAQIAFSCDNLQQEITQSERVCSWKRLKWSFFSLHNVELHLL